jgi:hypothetical protein
LRAPIQVILLLAVLAAPARAEEKSIAERAKTHWAYQPFRQAVVPSVRDRAWVRTPIDAFLLARIEAAGLRPAPAADRRTLLRRVTLDLTGLPPTPEEQNAFLSDRSPLAYINLVNRLLASPAYGERWGRHWLDVARYADTNGYERDGDKPSAWRYRDYVIDALNRDWPFDRFVMEQIAGDEMPGSDARMQIATTFLRLGSWDDEPANALTDRYDQLDDVLGTTATAFLAQTVRCARCHDHKFEPFSLKEYYRLLAVFEPLRRPQRGRADLDRFVGNEADLIAYRQASAEFVAKLEELKHRMDRARRPARDRVLADARKLPAEVRAAFLTPAGKRSREQAQLVKNHQTTLDLLIRADLTDKEKQQIDELDRQEARLKRSAPREPGMRAYIWSEDGSKAPVTHVFRRGNPEFPGAAVEPGVPSILAPASPAPPQVLERSTGRRLWLARWIASANNPLTARVIVNRVWQWHFGRGIVATAGDFGLMGEAPTHPELLDWLASEFVGQAFQPDGSKSQAGKPDLRWSLKHLHRLIVMSSAYQTSSAADDGNAVRKLALFGRWRQRRVEAEVVRDSMLAVAGRLNRQAFGPGVYPRLSPAVLATQSRPGLGWGKSDERQSARRSVYVFAKRTLVVPELELLDSPDTTSSCEQRPQSTTAPQALTFLNGTFAHEQARHFADRLVREVGDDTGKQIERAFLLALGRPPREDERKSIVAFLDRQTRQIASEKRGGTVNARREALASFCLVLFNTNEFFYPG